MGQQTSYTNNPPAALAGMVEHTEGELIVSKVAEGAVGIGLLVVAGAQSMSVPGASTSLAASGQTGTVKAIVSAAPSDPITDVQYVGIVILDTSRMATDQLSSAAQGTFNYSTMLDKMVVGVMLRGFIWLQTDAAVAQYGLVYTYGTTQTNQPTGSWGTAAGTGKVAFPRARWAMTTSGAGLALCQIGAF